jgi:hypothetical protein
LTSDAAHGGASVEEVHGPREWEQKRDLSIGVPLLGADDADAMDGGAETITGGIGGSRSGRLGLRLSESGSAGWDWRGVCGAADLYGASVGAGLSSGDGKRRRRRPGRSGRSGHLCFCLWMSLGGR